MTKMVLWVGLCALALAGCGKGGAEKSGKPSIVVTTGMVGDIVRNVGGDHFEVTALMGPGTDPHLYKASPGDISRINKADLVLYSGIHLEGKMADIFEKVAEKKPVLAIGDQVPQDQLLGFTGPGAHDPHIWFDVSLWLTAVKPVGEFLAKHDPEHAEEYRKNADECVKKLQALHEEVKQDLAKIPKERRVMITAHDAFRYFGRAYDVEVRGIQGISTESEAGVREINNLVDLMVKRKIPAVFVETSVSAKNIQALIEGAQRRGLKAKVGGSLYSDAMGAEGTPDGTYEGMIRHNVKALVDALK